jgi:DNA/RNA-binding domain of Phe-tRNA-synthetase-like protein
MKIEINEIHDQINLVNIEITNFDNTENHLLTDYIFENFKIIDINPPSDQVKKETRNLLRNKKYSPTGRAKPASEFLLNTYQTSKQFPLINPIVDINNYISIKSGLPSSVFDLKKISGPIKLRLGLEAESYIFNNAGHDIKLKDLIVLLDDHGPFGTPVKDSMRCKCSSDCKNALGVIYCAKTLMDDLKIDELLGEWEKLCTTFLKADAVHINMQ